MRPLQCLALAVLALSSGASAYVVRAYKGPHCLGKYQIVNVWKNNKATWIKPFQSVRVVRQGEKGQRATFCNEEDGNCIDFQADGRGGDFFREDICNDLAGTYTIMYSQP